MSEQDVNPTPSPSPEIDPNLPPPPNVGELDPQAPDPKSGDAEPQPDPKESEGDDADKKDDKDKKESVEEEPITVDSFKIPEGLEVNEDSQKEFVELLNNQDLSRAELAQKLIDLQASTIAAASEKASQNWIEIQDKWQKEIKTDKEFGGDKFNDNSAAIAQLINDFGDDALKQVFDVTGAGNNIHVFKFLSKIAVNFTEGRPTTGSPSGGEMTQADVIYPNQGKA